MPETLTTPEPTPVEMVTVNGTEYPIDSDDIFKCVHCDERHHVDDKYNTSLEDGSYVCNACYEDNYSYCEDCDYIHLNSDGQYRDNLERFVCDKCKIDNYYQCSDCDDLIHVDDAIETIR